MYNLFKRYSIDISQEELSAIEMLRHTHERLLKRARQVTHELVNSEQTFLERFLLDQIDHCISNVRYPRCGDE